LFISARGVARCSRPVDVMVAWGGRLFRLLDSFRIILVRGLVDRLMALISIDIEVASCDDAKIVIYAHVNLRVGFSWGMVSR